MSYENWSVVVVFFCGRGNKRTCGLASLFYLEPKNGGKLVLIFCDFYSIV
nr:MAG TPA: hypothetical protein [Caudoviricetes sp.]